MGAIETKRITCAAAHGIEVQAERVSILQLSCIVKCLVLMDQDRLLTSDCQATHAGMTAMISSVPPANNQ